MNSATFCRLAELLTGTPVKDVAGCDCDTLDKLLANEDRRIDCSQINELLLLVNKDRMEQPFFDWFFGLATCSIGNIEAAVEKFQKIAMLRYGNFIYAYRTLSRLRSEDLKQELKEFARDPDKMVSKFESRSPKLVDIVPIERSDTPLVGYLTPGDIIADAGYVKQLIRALPNEMERALTSWDDYQEGVLKHPLLKAILGNYRTHFPGTTITDFASYLEKTDSLLSERNRQLESVRGKAERNQNTYLSWDHMDVYFATSMRKRWEYEDLYDFVNELMAQEVFSNLNLRYFDPTQAYTKNRVDKGLVESLMLKRAKCTVYSVQDTDTLGKDSELAATLAQGKPVIAYIPKIDIEARTNVLFEGDSTTVEERLRFVLYADEQFNQSHSSEDQEFQEELMQSSLKPFGPQRILRSITDGSAVAKFRQTHARFLQRLCSTIAASEQRIYNKRAKTLSETHPLAIQVNLASGVANGVLVVRTIPECASLLRSILTNSMEFDIEDSSKDNMWYLKEKISGCVYRVVSKDRRLTNCFWNFYHQPQN